MPVSSIRAALLLLLCVSCGPWILTRHTMDPDPPHPSGHALQAMVVPCPAQLIGRTFGTARCMFSDAVVVGVLQAGGGSSTGNSSSAASAPGGSSGGWNLSGGSGGSGTSGSSSWASGLLSVHTDGSMDSRVLAASDQLVMFAPARVRPGWDEAITPRNVQHVAREAPPPFLN